jgi:hypothetical protein
MQQIAMLKMLVKLRRILAMPVLENQSILPIFGDMLDAYFIWKNI